MKGSTKAAAVAPRHVALVLLLPLLLYARSIEFDYVRADDVDLIAGNQTFLRDLRNAPRAFERSYFETETDAIGEKTYYRPVAIVSFMLDAQLGGDDPRAYHATNVMLHAVVCAMLLVLAIEWGAPLWGAVAAALVFAVHPVNVQTVAWIAGRNDLLLAVLGLLSLIAWARAETAARARLGWAAGHVLAFALALFAKETGVVLPLLVLLYEGFVRRQRLSRAQWIVISVDALVVMGWVWLRGKALAGAPTIALTDSLSIALANSPQLLVHAGKLMAPVRLNVSPSIDATSVALGVLAVAVLGAIAARRIPRGLVIVGVAWVLAFLVPTLVVPGLPVYEHRNYLPLAGVLLMLAAGGLGQTVARRGPWGAAFIGLLLMVLALQTYRRQEVFRDPFTYWTDAARDAQFAPVALVNLGQLHEGTGRLNEARRAYEHALSLAPDTPKAHNNLGVVLMKLGERERAIAQFEEEARRHPWNGDAWFNLGVAAEQKGELAEARRYYARAREAGKVR
jgi:tetratricopeptide (TPR) repeat protein